MFNALCERFEIAVPVFAFSHAPAVVAAVTEAGGFGVLGGSSMTPEQFDDALTWLDERVPGRYGVDLIFPAKSAGEDIDELRTTIPDEHKAFVDDLKREFGVPERNDPETLTTIGGLPSELDHLLTIANATALWRITRRHQAKLIVSALGPLPPEVHAEAREDGMLIGGLVGAPRHARRQAERGVDLIVAQGSEAGGHTGSVSTLVIVPQIVEAAGDVPVLAAGGVANGAQVAACLALGAQGVWMGSAWVASLESDIHPIVKQRVVEATSADAQITHSISGKPTRQLATEWTKAWTREGAPETLPAPVQALVSRDPIVAAFEHENPAFMGTALGQCVSYIKEQEPVAVILGRIAAELDEALGRVRDLPPVPQLQSTSTAS